MPDLTEIMTIGKVAANVGMRSFALRYYESVGLLPAPKRVSSQRRYDASILTQIRFIQVAQKLGLSISEIKTLLNAEGSETLYSERLQTLARRKIPEAEALIARAQELKSVLEASLACRCHSFEDCHLL